jgi:hypothetical protein
MAMAASISDAGLRHPAAAWAFSLLLAAIAFVLFAVVLRPRLLQAGSRPASANPRLSRLAAGSSLLGVAVVSIIGSTPLGVVVVAIGYGGIFGLILWIPTLEKRGA